MRRSEDCFKAAADLIKTLDVDFLSTIDRQRLALAGRRIEDTSIQKSF